MPSAPWRSRPLLRRRAGPGLCEKMVGQGERCGGGGPLLPIDGFVLETVAGDVIIHEGLTYTEAEVCVLGELVDGTLAVDPLSS